MAKKQMIFTVIFFCLVAITVTLIILVDNPLIYVLLFVMIPISMKMLPIILMNKKDKKDELTEEAKREKDNFYRYK